MGSIYGIPFTEIFEKVQADMGNKSTGTAIEEQFRNRVNEIYAVDLPRRGRWSWMEKESTITIAARYNTGTVGIDTSGNVTGVGTTFVTGQTGYQMKVDGHDEVMTFTYASATTGTVSPAPATAISAGTSYELYQTKYDLPADFVRFVEPAGEEAYSVWRYNGGTRMGLEDLPDGRFSDWFISSSGDYPTYFRLATARTSSKAYQIELNRPPQSAFTLHIRYIKALPYMVEVTSTTFKTGTTTTKVLTTANLYGVISVGQWLRCDDNKDDWALITAVAADTTTGDGITVDTLVNTPANTDPLTVCDMPDMPFDTHDLIVLGAKWKTAQKQGNKMVRDYKTDYLEAIVNLQVKLNARNWSASEQLGPFFTEDE